MCVLSALFILLHIARMAMHSSGGDFTFFPNPISVTGTPPRSPDDIIGLPLLLRPGSARRSWVKERAEEGKGNMYSNKRKIQSRPGRARPLSPPPLPGAHAPDPGVPQKGRDCLSRSLPRRVADRRDPQVLPPVPPHPIPYHTLLL